MPVMPVPRKPSGCASSVTLWPSFRMLNGARYAAVAGRGACNVSLAGCALIPMDVLVGTADSLDATVSQMLEKQCCASCTYPTRLAVMPSNRFLIMIII